ncbi:hypothetical protein SAMN04487787_101634 [Kosakonia sacchari]|nr:hypothetical protein SAMN04487787_101634 [Kosakonia sacchari]
MNSLNRYRPTKQFRCPPLVGRNAPFGYVERVRGVYVDHNYQRAAGMVEAFATMNEHGREEWLKLTGGSETTAESRYGSSDGSQKGSALSIFVKRKATSMNASARLSSSSVNSEK